MVTNGYITANLIVVKRNLCEKLDHLDIQVVINLHEM